MLLCCYHFYCIHQLLFIRQGVQVYKVEITLLIHNHNSINALLSSLLPLVSFLQHANQTTFDLVYWVTASLHCHKIQTYVLFIMTLRASNTNHTNNNRCYCPLLLSIVKLGNGVTTIEPQKELVLTTIWYDADTYGRVDFHDNYQMTPQTC